MNPTVIALAVTVLGLAGGAIYLASRGERTQLHGLLMTLAGALGMWSLGYAVFLVAPPGQVAQFAMMTLFLGVFMTPPVWVILAVHHTRLDVFDEQPGWLIGLLVPPAMTALAVVTNPGHRLFIRDFDPQLLQQHPQTWAGPLFWGGLGWGVMLMCVGTVIYLGAAVRMVRSGEARRGAALAGAVLMPFVASTVSGIYFKLDLTVSYIALSAAMLFVLSWRHRAIETLPLARRDVIDHLVEAVILADASGHVLDANPASEKLVGHTLSVLEGEPLTRVLGDLANEVHAIWLIDAIDRLIATGAPVQAEFDTDDDRCVEVTAGAVRAGDGEPTSFYALLRDRTEQRRLGVILRQSQRLETTASLSAGIVHEIKNPLSFVKSNVAHIQRVAVHLAEEKGEDDPDAVHLLDLAAAAEESLNGIDRIAATIERMRRFSRLRTGEMGDVDVHSVVEDSIKMARLRGGAELRVRVREAPSLPMVRGSEEHLVQVLLNLIDNARQALVGRLDARIDLTTRRAAHAVEIRVRDNGPGIPEEVQERIFDAFYTTKDDGEGTGIGLAISFAIVREHGGALDFESRPGQGTEFTIRLPIPAAGEQQETVRGA
jgi:PAS domain S-box-containing protein